MSLRRPPAARVSRHVPAIHQRSIRAWSPVLLLLVLTSARLLAQLPSAELHAVSPPVIPAGQPTEISLTGANLESLSGLLISDPRIKAEPVMLPPSEFRKHPAQNGTRFLVTVPTDFPEGVVEIRAAGYFGLSTSRPLAIAPKDQVIVADAGAAHHQIDTAPELAREALARGQTDANQIDYWKFTAKKGERLLVHCRAERIDSRADATLTVVDARGHELERSRDAIGRDPLIDFTAPADGTYWIGVHDFLYTGGATHPYLLTLSARPWIDAVFPPAGQQGQVMEATLLGRNLPGGSPGEGLSVDGKPIETLPVRLTVPESPDAPGYEWARPSHGLLPKFTHRHENANSVEIGLADAPVVPVHNDATPPTVTPPVEIAARFDTDGDSDEFRFAAKKGTAYWIEVIGDRMGGKIDPYLVVEKITRAADGGETFAKVRDADDSADRAGATFDGGSRDADFGFTADQDGEYRVTVVNQFASGGPLHAYRLAIREARPDFELLAVAEREYLDTRQAFPAAPLLRKGGTTSLRVIARRRDGFAGDITLTAEGLPAGVTCPPLTLSPKEDTGRLVFHAATDAAVWSGNVAVTGTATVGDQALTRPLRVGSLVWGSADYSRDRLRSRLELGIPLAVSAEESTPLILEVAGSQPLTVTLGEKLEIPVKAIVRNGIKGDASLTLEGLRGLTRPPVVNLGEKAEEAKLTLDFKPQNNVFAPEAGTWHFVVKASGTVKYRHHPQAAERAVEDQKHAETLAKQHSDAAAKAKTAADQANQAVATAEKTLATASPDAKPAAEKALADARTQATAAAKAAADAAAKQAAATKAATDAAARAKAATDKAKEKDVKFATYSLPVTVEVKPAPEKK